MKSDLALDAISFAPESIPDDTKAFNEAMLKASEGMPEWYEVGAAKYRAMRESGETSLKPRPLLPQGKDIELPSREAGRTIPCRWMASSDKPDGIMVHMHGGGWVLASHRHYDPLLFSIASHTNLAVISVGFRLAPEHPYPAPVEDCFDVAEFLAQKGPEKFGLELMVMGGDSAGGHLSMLSALHLVERFDVRLRGLLMIYGVFNLGFSPSSFHFDVSPPVLNLEAMRMFVDAFVPGATPDQLREISPLYYNLNKLRGRLPRALFVVGTNDILLDDSVLMSTKWRMAGAETVLTVIPGAPHGFIHTPPDQAVLARQASDAMMEFLSECMR